MPRTFRQTVARTSTRYIAARGISAALSLIFAFVYSKALGVENRSILTFAMATNLILAIFFTSGTTLAFRKKYPREKSRDDISIVMVLLIFESLLAAIAVLIAMAVYSTFKIHLAGTLIAVIFVYSFIATLSNASLETILAIGKFGLAAILEMITIILQICVYFTMQHFKLASVAVSVLVSLMISYLVSLSYSSMLLVAERPGTPPNKVSPYWNFLKFTRHNHSYVLSNGFVDRIDRVIIGWFLPVGLLGQFAVTTSLISYMRFIPDAITKLIISKTKKQKAFSVMRPKAGIIFVGLLVVACGVWFSQFLIKIYFGPAWMLPILIPGLFALQELARASFQIECSVLMVSGNETIVAKQNSWMAITGFLLCIIGVKVAGLYGAPISLSLNYVIHTLLLRQRQRSSLI